MKYCYFKSKILQQNKFFRTNLYGILSITLTDVYSTHILLGFITGNTELWLPGDTTQNKQARAILSSGTEVHVAKCSLRYAKMLSWKPSTEG